ncbi:hypothetical protein [Gloeothece verrucosa]|uniref:Uncharacterized protein n=1 Tax=Gloeothece verrucosa (strain PCC 7822) TaxID=497965 RepID=E0U9Y8_GLOV7|nr:hypothetical protein [Gloeothece verrucosa]ADN15058.1 hypothetical protein Cyan7822_3103 [Gloeothece verrucosa PCC 7822]
MERVPPGVKKIFKSYLIVIAVDLIISIIITVIYQIKNSSFSIINDSKNIFVGTKYVPFAFLVTLAFAQSFILLPASLILLFLRKWEIAVGIILADLTMLFLGALLCGGVLG